MLALLRVLLAISLAVATVVAQYLDDNRRIIHVSELITEDGSSTFATTGEDLNICCVSGNCTCNSLDHALANLTSNVPINITTDVTLSSHIEISNLQNTLIIGYNNPSVNCKSIGGIHFRVCHNCNIQGITWDGCGTIDIDNRTKPGLKLSNSSNVTIHGCTFQNSIGQAVSLLQVSGDVNISHCSFINNHHYRGHGAAIHYSTTDKEYYCSHIVFTVAT